MAFEGSNYNAWLLQFYSTAQCAHTATNTVVSADTTISRQFNEIIE
jgi:hypothetical protein